MDGNTGCLNGTKTGYSSNYVYNLGSLPPGSYYLLGIQDNDDDSEFCESGDECLYYGMDNQFYPITVQAGTTTNNINLMIAKRTASRIVSGEDTQKLFSSPSRLNEILQSLK